MGRKKKKKFNLKQGAILKIVFIIILIAIYFSPENQNYISDFYSENNNQIQNVVSYNFADIPAYEGNPYVVINNNIPDFNEEDYTTESFEKYSELDSLGRCGVAYANISKEIMPSDEADRGSISSVYPSGWINKKYENLVDGDYLYNRCHLIGWQLSAEDANELNLITGTRYMNVEGMLPFENLVDDYFEKKENENNHVLYRVTPVFEGNNLVASGVKLEAYSVEDNGKGVCFNVYVYNVQPGISINYATGESSIQK